MVDWGRGVCFDGRVELYDVLRRFKLCDRLWWEMVSKNSKLPLANRGLCRALV